jgi:hypothetical protein
VAVNVGIPAIDVSWIDYADTAFSSAGAPASGNSAPSEARQPWATKGELVSPRCWGWGLGVLEFKGDGAGELMTLNLIRISVDAACVVGAATRALGRERFMRRRWS